MILTRLKQATASRHAALESRSVLLDPRLSHASYRQCLRRMRAYYAPLERRLLDCSGPSEAGPDYRQRQKTVLLDSDLLALGVTNHEFRQDPACQRLPDLSTAARLFGCLYVIEGATLGGRIVIRHLKASLAITPESGAAFFGGYGEHTGSRWKAFGAELSVFALRSGSGDEIVAGANETFETLDAWLYPVEPQTRLGHELASPA